MNKKLFLEQLQSLGTQERATADQRYHKSNRVHWGVPIPVSDKLTRSVVKELNNEQLMQLATELWLTDQFDAMICAAKMLAFPRMKPSELLWKKVLQFLTQVDGWALEDTLAHVAWKCILADLRLLDEVEKWTHSSNFWMRRAALVYTLPLAKPGRDPERSLQWASTYVSDPEWFIQKAIGWWLRVLGEHNPTRVIQFLQIHPLKGVAKREATRKLSPEFQQKILF